VVTVNSLHAIYTVKILVKQLLARFDEDGIKSGIMITSSGFGKIPICGFLPYSCSKTFVSFLAKGLNIELAGKVDVMAYEAGMVVTKFIEGVKSKADCHTIWPKDAA
jgi:short-subunit dehydrogenase